MDETEFQALTTQQKYAHTYERASAALSNKGYRVAKLHKDPQKAYFEVKHADGSKFCKVMVKNRLLFNKKFVGQGIYSCFSQDNQCYFYSHDELLEKVMQTGIVGGTKSWEKKGLYHFPTIGQKLLTIMEKYQLSSL